MMKKLLSLPPNLVECFHDVAGVAREEYFCTSDPVGARLGSGGGASVGADRRDGRDHRPKISYGNRGREDPGPPGG